MGQRHARITVVRNATYGTRASIPELGRGKQKREKVRYAVRALDSPCCVKVSNIHNRTYPGDGIGKVWVLCVDVGQLFLEKDNRSKTSELKKTQ